MCEQVCLSVLACLFLCERDIINIKLTIAKYVREVMCDCKSLSSVYMLNCPEIYIEESGTGFEWKELRHALHKICFFPPSFFPCNYFVLYSNYVQ